VLVKITTVPVNSQPEGSAATAGLLAWTTSAPAVEHLQARGALVLDWHAWRRDLVRWLTPDTLERATLDPPAREQLRALTGRDAVAVLGVRLVTLEDVRCLHETLLVPVLRTGVPLLIECDQTPDDLDDAAFMEPGFEHAATLERMRWLHTHASLGDVGFPAATAQPPHRSLDAAQQAAAKAPGGVVQVIAPAGSGKTTVLVERARELLARGADPERILCVTFNDAAATELRERLETAGAGRVAARTFHAVGHRIIRAHRLVEGRALHLEGWTVAQWGRFGRLAAQQVGTEPPEAADLPHELAAIRLGELADAEEWERDCPSDDHSRCIARVYTLVEREKERRRLYDFDDMIALAVRLMRSDRAARLRWQAMFEHVLVDEYQDIEPAQELLVRMLAAPHDDVFVVGDEDQTLYGWRRASVHRMIDLDAAFPALRRVALEHNYRCTPEVIGASAALIAHSRLRFEKRIRPGPGRAPGGGRALRLAHYAETERDEGARLLARKLRAHTRPEIAVLARTINALRAYALAAAAAGVAIAGPEELFEAAGAQETLEAYFAVFSDPRNAREADVRVILRRPARGVPGQDAAQRICDALGRGMTLPDAVEALPAAAAEQWRLARAAERLAALRGIRDAAAFIARLRRDGLDRYFDEVARASARPDRDDRKVLDDAEQEAAGQSLADYAGRLAARRSSLRAARDDRNGIELTTVHRAKGRQWPRVVLVACDEGVLPHSNALQASAEEIAAGEGVEAERRIAYVAFTRAQDELSILYTEGRHSRFLHEAGLVAAPPPRPDTPAGPQSRAGFWQETRPTGGRRRPGTARSVEEHVERAREVGLHHALTVIADRNAALEFAAVALERELAGPATRSDKLTVRQLLKAIGALTGAQRDAVRRAVPWLKLEQRIAELPAATRTSLAAALRAAREHR
jgi:DNA helicase-2/ATP-dependent DNA helicase PcrA